MEHSVKEHYFSVSFSLFAEFISILYGELIMSTQDYDGFVCKLPFLFMPND